MPSFRHTPRSCRNWLSLTPIFLLLQVTSCFVKFCDAVKPSSSGKPTATASSTSNLNNVRVSSVPFASTSSPNTTQRKQRPKLPQEPRQVLQPPFPNGPCGGTVLEIDPEDTFGVDVNLANINVLGDLILMPRPIQIWLPPGYDDKPDVLGHPVLYVHDGQNAMEDAESWTGASWRLAGALTRLGDHELLQTERPLPIVVMIPSADGDLLPGIRRRHLEYGDINFPFSQAHADFVAETVKPLVDNRFHTNPSPNATFAIGSSLGGQASMHLLLRHADKFGGAACLSPAFGPAILDQVRNSGDSLRGKRIYLDIGGDQDEIRVPLIDVFDHLTPEHWWNPGYFWLDTQLQGQVTSMRQAMDQAGVRYKFRQYPGGRHNERAWAQRIHIPLKYLFGGTNLRSDVVDNK
ncbi:putative esterase [Nitzschia inconspicua]|uniref:Esterase n=1 Tax=Nitzschia inconspicua TaxID=303405 RepID=A0A9K3PWR8_9STRA|nr:putative esterase [Nitzschia inconspicua]